MRKKVLAALTLAAVLITGLSAALAAPGSGDDSFVSRSYLTDVYYAQAEQAMLQQAQAATAQTEQAALDKLSTLAGSYLAQAGAREYADSFLRVTLARGDRLEVPAGTSLSFEAGQGTLVLASGSLVDVTDGVPVSDGGRLTAGHRYVAAEDAACSFTAVTDAVILSVRGSYGLERTGAVQTPFTDLADTDWYYPYVRFVYDQGLLQGTTTTQFSPGSDMTRVMLATALYRMAGVQGAVPSVGFSDVPTNIWYVDAVNWAAGAGVVTGYEDNTFRPDVNVTREQIAVMLYRYAKDYAGLETTSAGDLSAFSDRAQASAWAEDALSWAVGEGIINGYEDGRLSPGGTATRAEVATMLQRFSSFRTARQ